MTNREFLTNVVNGTVTDADVNFAKEALLKLDAANSKRREKTAERAEANKAYVEKIGELLTSEAQTASDLMAKLIDAGVERAPEKDGSVKEWTVQYVSSLCRAAVADGVAAVIDVKVPKHGTQKGYVLAE